MFKHVLVTGASGFIGLHLVEALHQQGIKIRALGRDRSRLESLASLGAEVRRVDFSDLAQIASAIEDVDTVFHLAGATAGTECELMEANAHVTGRLATVCSQRTSVPRFLLVSSMAASGPSTPALPRCPEDPPAPVSFYGKSKLAGEQAALAFAPQLPLTIVRPAIVFGPRDREVVQMVQPIARLGLNFMAGRHDPPLSWIHVADLVSAILKAAAHGVRCPAPNPAGLGIYHVADPETLSQRAFAQRIAPWLGRSKVRHIRLPIRMVRFAATANQTVAWLRGRHVTFNRDKIREAAAVGWTCDVRKTQAELQWAPGANLSDRLREWVETIGRD